MALGIGGWTVFYLADALVWIVAFWLIPTRFFGIPAKPSKYRLPVFAAAVTCNVLASVLIYFLFVKNGGEPAGTSGGISLFCIIYWMFFLEEKKRFKRLISLIATDVLTETFLMFTACLISTAVHYDIMPPEVAMILFRHLTTIGLIWLASAFSSRRRKEPMRFSHILSIWIFCELLELTLGIFDVEGYEDVQYFISIRVAILTQDGENKMMNVVAALAVILVLFIVMVVKESESLYFQKKNAVSEYYLEAQRDHYAALTESNREIRKVKHDMKNHIYCLKELYDRENYEELGRYLNAMDENLQHAAVGVHVGNEIADAIIAEKQKIAKQKEILFEVMGDMSGVRMAAIDVCIIFSNIIDNGIEAAEKLPEAHRRMRLEIRKNKNFLLILESNPVGQKPQIRDNAILTTKKDGANHGFGLVTVKEAAAVYGGDCLLDVSGDGDACEFTIQVMIPLASVGTAD